jgi:hypothetical protein
MERWLGAVLYLVTAGASDVTVVGQAGRPPAGGEDISNSMSRRGVGLRWKPYPYHLVDESLPIIVIATRDACFRYLL